MRVWADATDDAFSRSFKRRFRVPIAAIASAANGATDARVRADLDRLPHLLDAIDELIAAGTIGTPEPTAADFQILSSVGVWTVLADLRPFIVDRPCGRAAAALFPRYTSRPGLAPGVLPPDWFSRLRGA